MRASILSWLGLALVIAGCGSPTDPPFERRVFETTLDGEWIGNAISYGPYRDGQAPGAEQPSREEIREDLHLIAQHWKLLRIYGSQGSSETILELIRGDELGLRVMLGAWIEAEDSEENRVRNVREVDEAIRLTNAYPDVVAALSVGNETQVYWSAHRGPLDPVIAHVRRARAAVEVPVTSADDYNYWNKEESAALAREIDFLALHIHPLWNGILLEDAVAWTAGVVESIQDLHPEVPVVLAETGWATQKHDEGEQARLIKDEPDEEGQAVFYREWTRWSEEARLVTFFFEAFDEKWKGGPHPNEVEKHWGLYRSDRTPKKAMARND